MKRTILIMMLIFIPQTTLAGAWVQKPWQYYLRLANKFYAASAIFNQDANRKSGDWWDSNGKFREFSMNLIMELGVLEQLTLLFENTAKFMQSDYGSRDVAVYGLSDVVLGARYGFYQKSLVAAVEGKIEIPTGYPRNGDRVSLGPGYVNGQLKVLFGGGLPLGIGNYFDTAIGYRLRGGSFADDLLASVSFGVETVSDLWLRIGGNGVFNLGEASQSNLGNLDASYLSAGGAVTYLFQSGWGLEIAGSADLWGKNTFSGWGLELVVQYRSK